MIDSDKEISGVQLQNKKSRVSFLCKMNDLDRLIIATYQLKNLQGD